MSDINDPEKYEMATIVTKNSKTGISSNKRLLVIKKGHLYYYSSVPKEFKNDTKFLESYPELPKCSIELLNIKKINGFQSSSKYFSIQFEARHMMEREDIRKTMTLQQFNFAPKNTKEMITWQFTCDNQFVKQKWVHDLEKLHAHYSKQKINIQKFFDNINKKEQQKCLAPPVRSSLMIPWRDDQLKKSGSNDNLRKSYLISPRVSTSIVPTSMSKKSISSQQRSPPNQTIKTSSMNEKNATTEQIIQSFMKTQPKKNSPTHRLPETSVLEQSMEESMNTVITPNRDDFTSSRRDLLSSKKLKSMDLQELKGSQTKKSDPKLGESILNLAKKQSVQFDISQQKQIQFIEEKQRTITQQKKQIPKQHSSTKKDMYNKQHGAEMNDFKNQVSIQKKKIDIRQPSKQEQKSQSNQQQKQEKTPILKNPLPNTILVTKLEQELKQLPSIQKILSLQSKNNKEKYQNQMINNRVQYKITANTLFCQLLYFGINREYSFEKRIEAQQKLNSMIGSFTDRALRSFTQFVGSKGNSSNGMGRFSQQKIDEGLSFVEIGYTKFKVAYVTTQAISINEKKKIFYNESSVKSIKRQMSVYNKLHSLIVSQIKNFRSTKTEAISSLNLSISLSLSQATSEKEVENSQTRINEGLNYPSHIKVTMDQLRVPLCAYLEYKGICAMAYDETNSSIQKQLADKDQLNQWRELLRFLGLNSNCFEFKTMETNVGSLVIAYITSTNDIYLNGKQPKHHNVTFESPMSTQFLKKAKKQGASTSIQSLLNYIKSIQSIKDTSMFTCPREQIVSTLQYCYVCKYLRKFYRSSQAELDELKFINLLLTGDKNIINLFESSGFEFQPKRQNRPITGIFFQFLLYYLGINCEVDTQKLQKYGGLPMFGIKNEEKSNLKIIKNVKLQPRVIGLNLEIIQLYKSYAKLDKYIANKNKQLAHKTLQMKQQIYFQNGFQPNTYPWPAISECIFSSSQLNYLQNDYITSISKSKQFLSLVSPSFIDAQEGKWHKPSPSKCIPVYFLMIKCYSKFSREMMNETLKQAIESALFNFGENSSMLITVFAFAALTYQSIGEYSQAQLFLQTAIRIGERVFADYKKTKLSQLYLDIGKIFLIQNKINEANGYIEKAQKIVQECGAYEQKLNLLLFNLQILVKGQNTIESQEKSMHLIFEAQNLLKKQVTKFSTMKQFYHLIFQIGMKFKKAQICEKAIQQLWQLDTNSKTLAVQLSYRIISDKFQDISSQYYNIVERWFLSKQKSILLLEQNMKNYHNFFQMVNQAFAQEDTQFMSAFFKILPIEALKIK